MCLVSTEMEKAEGKADLVDLRAEVGSGSESVGNWRDHVGGGINIFGV